MKPFVNLNFGSKKFRVGISLGWFPGELFKLFSLSLFEVWEPEFGVSIIELTVAKFSIHISIY